MDLKIENRFVDTFIHKQLKSRMLFELSSHKKREKAISRFSHEVEKNINVKRIALKTNNFNKDEFLNLFKNIDCIYCISFKYLDGVFMDKEELYEYMLNEYSSVIAITDSVVVIKEEYVQSSGNYYLLKSE